jgi:hypothetical protein
MGDRRSAQPIFDVERIDAGKLTHVVRYESAPSSQGVRRYQEVVVADLPANALQLRANVTVEYVRWMLERHHCEGSKHAFDFTLQARRPILGSAAPEFTGDDDTGDDLIAPNTTEARRSHPARIPDEVRQDVRVQQMAHARQISTGSGG